jgi:hypothetical protein
MQFAASECTIIGILVWQELDDEVLVQNLEHVAVRARGVLPVLAVVKHLRKAGV